MMAEKSAEPPPFDNAKLFVWVKGLEGKVNNLLREMDLLKNDLIKKSNQMKKEVKVFSEDLVEMKHQQEKMAEKMDLIIKELKQTAGIEEMMTLKKYIEYWNPINFVTQRDVERLVENKLNEKESKVSKKELNKKEK